MVAIGRARFALFHWALQAHLLHQSLDALVVHCPSLPPQQRGQTTIAIGRIVGCQCCQRLPQRSLILPWLRVVERAAR